jgi:hypothetical protein
MGNLQFAKERLGSPRRITISTVIEEWNIAQVERLLDWCGEQGFVFAAQSAQSAQREKMPNLALLNNPRYPALVDTIIARRRENKQAIHGTGRTIETLLRFRDFACFPTMFSAGLSKGGRILSVRAVAENRGKPDERWIVAQDIYGGEEKIRRHSTLPGNLLPVWKRAFALLRK